MERKFIYTEEVTGEIVNIPIELLHHHHDNPRKESPPRRLPQEPSPPTA